MYGLLIKSLKDFFDKRILLLSLIPVAASALFLGIIYFIFSDAIHIFFVSLISHIPFIDGEYTAMTLQGIVSIFIFYELVLILSVLLVGLIADRVVDRINEKYYHLEKQGFGTMFGAIAVALKANIIFILLFIVLIPTMFIPVINILVQVMLWTILIKTPFLYDSLSLYATKEQFAKIKKTNRLKLWTLSFVAASLFLVPVFGIFVYMLQLILFIHFNLGKLQKMQKII